MLFPLHVPVPPQINSHHHFLWLPTSRLLKCQQQAGKKALQLESLMSEQRALSGQHLHLIRHNNPNLKI